MFAAAIKQDFDNLPAFAQCSVAVTHADETKGLLVEKSGGTKTHTVGYVNHYDGDDDVFVCNNFILGLRPKKELVNYMYLFYQLRYMYGLGMFSDCYNKTTGIQNLQVKAYLEKSIPVLGYCCHNKLFKRKWLDKQSNPSI